NGKYYLIRKRKITIKNYVKDVKMDKFVSLLIVIALIFVAVRFSFKGANNESVFWLVFLGISGFVSNLIYFFDLRINMHLDSLGKRLKKSLEHDELKRD
ncbi:MAG: hypothetical protein K6B64_05755, partial [Acholeplasmatales bacterium]|nr:hypothetical protein [Acholeplasmatales bacterium]